MSETISEMTSATSPDSSVTVGQKKLRLALINSFGSLEAALTEAVIQPVNALAALKVVLSAVESKDELAAIVNAETPVIPEGQSYRSMGAYYQAPLHRVIARIAHAGGAVPEEDVQVVKALVEAGADVNKRSGQSGGTPLYESAPYAALAPVTECLLGHGADVNAGTQGGYTPLAYALARNTHLPTIKLLLERGANPFAVTEKGETLEQIAKPSLPAMNLLIKARKSGRDITIDSSCLDILVYSKVGAALREVSGGAQVDGEKSSQP